MAKNHKPDPSEIEPSEYEIPLSQDQLLALGRCTAVFSQIDYMMGDAIHLITKTPWYAMDLMLETATSGPKLSILRKLVPHIEDKSAKTLAKKFVEEMNSLIEKRNHMIHGIWCIVIMKAQKTTKAGCHFSRHTKHPILASDIHKIANRAAKASRIIGDLLLKLSPVYAEGPWTKPRRLFVATENMDLDNIPDWLGGPVELLKTGYPNLGEIRPKPLPPREPS